MQFSTLLVTVSAVLIVVQCVLFPDSTRFRIPANGLQSHRHKFHTQMRYSTRQPRGNEEKISIEISSRQSRPRRTCEITRLFTTSRIARGAKIVQRSSPYVLIRGFDGSNLCSGTLITSNWVLSAAHCKARIGDIIEVGRSIGFKASVRHISQVEKHKDFKELLDGSMVNDVMLIRFDKPVKNKRVRLNSNTAQLPENVELGVLGYGLSNRRTANNLEGAQMCSIPVHKCRSLFENVGFPNLAKSVNRQMHLCANHERCRVSTCDGDSGGPLLTRHADKRIVQVGITSYSTKYCGVRKLPDVFTHVAFYKHWIRSVTKDAKFIKLRPIDFNKYKNHCTRFRG